MKRVETLKFYLKNEIIKNSKTRKDDSFSNVKFLNAFKFMNL